MIFTHMWVENSEPSEQQTNPLRQTIPPDNNLLATNARQKQIISLIGLDKPIRLIDTGKNLVQ